MRSGGGVHVEAVIDRVGKDLQLLEVQTQGLEIPLRKALALAAPSRGGVVATADGTIYVSDVNAGVVTLIRNDQIVDVIKVDGRPHGLTVDPSTGDVYTSSTNASNWNVTRAAVKRK